MISKYFTSLGVAVVLATLVFVNCAFVTHAIVRSGTGGDESLAIDFTVDSGDRIFRVLSDGDAALLARQTVLRGEGPVRVGPVRIESRSQQVSWKSGRQTNYAPGIAMTIQYHWDTDPNAANGARGHVFLRVPQIPKDDDGSLTIRNGAFHLEDDALGHLYVAGITTYQSSFLLWMARFVFAMVAGIPVGVLMHAIYFWGSALRKEKKERLAQLRSREAGLPQTFYPDPILEWRGLFWPAGTSAVVILTGFDFLSEGYLREDVQVIIYLGLAAAATVGLLTFYFTRRNVVSIRIEPDRISYARGRGDVAWQSVPWGEIESLVHRSRYRRGKETTWWEFEFKDRRPKLKVPMSTVDYGVLSSILDRPLS